MSAPLTPEVRALLVLHLVPGLGPRLTAALLDRFGSAEAVLDASSADLCEIPHIGPKLAADILEAVRRADVDGELARMEGHGVRLLALGTTEYPESLATIPDPSHLLYIRGTVVPRPVMESRTRSARR
jgi:DNA processing protein